jgi:hypothetical protein
MLTSESRKTLRPDSKGRITLGALSCGASSFKAYRDDLGRIILEPQVEVPAAEAWLWRNPAAMKSVQQGLADASEDKVIGRGGFTQYAQEDDG